MGDDDPAEASAIPAALRDAIGYNLRIAQDASFQAIRAMSGGSAVKPGWYTVLTIIDGQPGLTPSALSRICGRDRSTLAVTLKELAGQGLITRRRKRSDARSYTVRLSSKGMEMLPMLHGIAARHDARLDAIVGADKAALLAILRRIGDGLKQESAEGA